MIIYLASTKERIEKFKGKLTDCTSYDLINAEISGLKNHLRRRANILGKHVYSAETLYRQFVSHSPESICIDEYLVRRKEQVEELVKAIKMVREDHPEIKIWLWFGILTPFKSYRELYPLVDMILVEQYLSTTCPLMLWFWYKRKYKRFKKHGMADKLLFVLGANQADRLNLKRALKFEDPNYWLPYAKHDTFKIVIPYIKKNCPGPGVGLYDAGAQDWKIEAFLKGAEDVFRRQTE